MKKKLILLLLLVGFLGFHIGALQAAIGSFSEVEVFFRGEGDIYVSAEEAMPKTIRTKGCDGVNVVAILVVQCVSKGSGFVYMSNFPEDREEVQRVQLQEAYNRLMVMFEGDGIVKQLFVVTSGDLVEDDAKEIMLQIKDNVCGHVTLLGQMVGVESPIIVPYLKVRNSFLLSPYDISVTLDPREGKEFFSLHTKGRGMKY